MRKKIIILCISIFVLALILVVGSTWLVKKAKDIPPAEEQISIEEVTYLLSEAAPEHRNAFLKNCEEIYAEQGYLLRKDTTEQLITYIKEKQPQLEMNTYKMHVISVSGKIALLQKDNEDSLHRYEVKDVAAQLQPGDSIHVIATKDIVLQVTEKQKSQVVLKTAWIRGNSDGQLTVKYGDQEFAIANYDPEYTDYEDIVDLEIKDGGVFKVKVYTDKVNARLLSVKNQKIELEEAGTFPYAENIQVYKLFGE